MAEETLILRLQLLADTKNAKTVNDLIKRNKELQKVLRDAPKEGTKEYKALEKQLNAAKKEFTENRTEINKFNKELRTGKKEIQASESSLKGLSKTLKGLEERYKLMTKEQREASDGRALQASIKKTRLELLKAEKGLGDYRRQVGNYTRTLVGLNSGIAGIAVNVGQLSGLVKGLPALFRGASVGAKALVASLGPIAIIVGLITAAMSRFQSTIDRVQVAIAGATAAFDVVIERLGSLSGIFTAFQDGGFSGALDAIKNAFAGIGDEINNDVTAAAALAEALQTLRRNEIADIVRLAEIERDVATARRLSAELEATDRAAAADQLQVAIDLLEEKGRIELANAQEAARILREQVALTNDLTRVDDLEAVAEAEAKVIRVAAGVDNSTRDLIKRRDRLRKSEKKEQVEEISRLEQLLKTQEELTQTLKNQIATGQIATKTVEDLKGVTKEINDINQKFKELTEDNTAALDYQVGSVADYNAQLAKLNEQLANTNSESSEYLTIQNQISIVEAKRNTAIGKTTEAIERLNEQQEKQLELLGSQGTALLLEQQAQAAIEATVGTAEEKAKERLRIEQQLAQDLRDLQQFNLENELTAIDKGLEVIDEQQAKELLLYADNETKKTEILAQAEADRNALRKQQLEAEKELLEVSKENYEATEKEKTADEKAQLNQRKELRELAQDTLIEASKGVTELLSTIQEQRTEEELSQIDKREDLAIQEAELLNKTEAEKEAIRAKFEEERVQIERKAAAERKALAFAEATIDIAGAVIKSLNTPPPLNAALAASTAALGAVQLAIIAATNFADGGLIEAAQFANGGVVRPVALGDGRIVSVPNITPLANGDSVLATVKPNEVILNEQQQKAAGGAAFFAALGVPGFANGGRVSDFSSMPQAREYATGGYVPRFTTNIEKAKAYANGGAVAANNLTQIEQTLSGGNKELIKELSIALYLASKDGIQDADITNQIARDNERNQRRAANESV